MQLELHTSCESLNPSRSKPSKLYFSQTATNSLRNVSAILPSKMSLADHSSSKTIQERIVGWQQTRGRQTPQ